MGPQCEPTARATGTVVGSLVEQTHLDGFFVWGSDAHIEATVIRDILPDSEQLFGVGMEIRSWCAETSTGAVCDSAGRANVTLRGSLIERVIHHGLGVSGADALIEAMTVRDVLPRPSDQLRGSGINIQAGCTTTAMGLVCDPSAAANVTMRNSLVDRTHQYGIFIAASEAHIETTVVRDSAPQVADNTLGFGMCNQLVCLPGPLGVECDPASHSNLTLLGSLIERSYELGILVGSSDARIESSVVRTTSPRASDGRFGDGILVESGYAPASLSISQARIEDSARAGLSNFGAFASLQSTRIDCAAFELAGERLKEREFTFEDRGDNRCGCSGSDEPCKAVSAGLEPPPPPTGTD
jgi:hypothetical protein